MHQTAAKLRDNKLKSLQWKVTKIKQMYRKWVYRGWLAQQNRCRLSMSRSPRTVTSQRLLCRADAAAAARYFISWAFNLVKYGCCSALKRRCVLLKMISSVAYLNSRYAHHLVSVSQKHLLKQICFRAGSYGELLSARPKGFERAVVNSKNDIKMYTMGSRLSCVFIN